MYGADGVTRPNIRGCSVSPALSCISFRRPPSRLTSGAPAALVIGRKAAQERFSEEVSGVQCHSNRKRISQKLYRKFPHNSAETHSPHQAWIDSRNLTTITTEWKHRQPIFLHPTVEPGAIRPAAS